MSEILGLGLTHYPPLARSDEDMSWPLRWTLEDPDIPAAAKDPASWPAQMQDEWSTDRGARAATDHRRLVVEQMDRCRAALDQFRPDVVIIWGDDQYENFREDLIPPYAVLAYPDMEIHPWRSAGESSGMVGKPNVWKEGPDTSFLAKGRPDIARWLTKALLDDGIDVSYAYKPLHHPELPHAFLNTLLFLDYHRRGFDYPIIPFPINCYGSRVISHKGFLARFAAGGELDPPSPVPWRVMDVGAAVARACAASPYRVALVASSGWSHAFTTDKTWRLYPDIEADRLLYKAMVNRDVEVWRKYTTEQIEASGQQELLNWFALVGAMEELDRSPNHTTFLETHVFNSSKAFAIFEP